MRKLYYQSPLILLAWLGIIFSANAQCIPPTTPIINVSPAGAVCGQETVTFTLDPASIDANTTYSWTFGDPSSATNTALGTSVSHQFTPSTSGGSHSVTVTATPTGSAPQAVSWTDLVNVSVNGADLMKTDNAWSYTAGAASTQTIGEGESVGFVANANVKVAVGLSTVNSGPDLNSIDYALVADGATDEIQIHENSGASLGTFGNFVTGDTLGVGVLNGDVVYYKNGVVVYTSMVAPTLPLIVDISIPYVGASINGAFVIGQYCTSTATTTVTTTATPNFVIGSTGFDRQQTCKTIINPGDVLNVVFGFSSGYNGGHTYQIDYGEGLGFVPLTTNVVSHPYTSPGVYIVTVTGSSGVAGSCTGTYSDTIFYLDRPLADMNIAGSADVCEGETIFALNNTDTVNHRVVYYVWEWDDGTRDTVYYQDSAQHIFDLGANLLCTDVPSGGMPYDVTLYAVNECFEHTNSSPVTVSRTPEGELSNIDVECNSIASTTGIDFALDYCTYGISGTPSWNFGDPTSGALDSLAFPPDNPTHVFTGGPGIYNVTVNISTLCGEYNDSARVHILQEPTASASFSTNGAGSTPNGDGCNPVEVYYNNTSSGDSLTFDWTVSPAGGVSYINGTSDTSASPQFLFNTAGTFVMTMNAINRCDTSVFVDTIRVLDGPTVTLNTPTPTCDSFSYSPSVTYFAGGGVINTYSWEFRRLDGTILGTSNQAFPTYNFTSPGTYVSQVTIINDCTTQSASDTFTIQATPGPITVNGGIPVTTCVGDSPFFLTADSLGGTWSGTAISPAGEFYPSSVVAGTYTVYYNYDIGNGCPADVPVTITVNPLPTVSAGNNISICVNEPAFDITGATPVGGTWSGTGITDINAGTFDPATAGNGTFTLTYTYMDSENCENSDDLVVSVFGLPNVDAQGDVTYCDVDYDIQLNIPSPGGGTWSGTGVVNQFAGLFNIDTAGGVGVYPLIYSYTDANGCENADTIDVTIIDNLVASAGNPDTICINNGTYTLNGFSPAGGTWTGSGIIGTGPDFSPAVAGLGTQALVYNYSTGYTCEAMDTVEFVVSDFTPVDAGNDTLVCAETDEFTLTPVSPSNGVWSGTGVNGTTGTFDPAVSGPGTFTATYTYTDPTTNCISTDEIDITVSPLPTVDAGGTFTMCDTLASFPISGFTPSSGGTWSGPGITNPGLAMFNPSLAGGIGQYMLYYSYMDGNGCESTDSLVMDVVFGDTIRVKKARDTICINNGTYTITDFEPLGGTWSGNGIIGTSPNFSPNAAGVGTHTLTYTAGTGSCQKQITMQIIVQDIPVVEAGNDTLVCFNTSTFVLTGHSPLGGVWAGTGIVDPNVGTFNPSAASGTFVLTYTYTDPVTGCENVDTRTINVSPLPNVSVTGPITECLIPNDIALTNYNPAGGIWTGPGIVDGSNGIFNGDTAGGVGNYELVYTYTDGNGCVNDDTLEVNIIGLVTAEAGPGDTVCVYDNEITLLGNSPAGGTWTGTGITNATAGTFDPGQVSAGVYTLTYTIGTGTCESTDQTTVLVGGIPNVNANSNEAVCASDVAFTLLTATPADGYWTGTGITDSLLGVFDPQVSGTGLHTLTYSYVNPLTGCIGSDTKNVRVRPLPTVNAGDTVTYCNTPTNISLTGFTPTSGGIWSGPGIVDANNGVFNPITAGDVGEYDVVLTYTNNNNCTNWDTLHIVVTAGDTVNAGPNDTLCINDSPISLNGFPSGGVWSGSGITNTAGTFDPGQVSAGFYYPIYTVGTGTCERKDTIEIFVSGLPFVDAGNNIELCIDAGITTLTGQSPLTGYWMGSGILDSIAGTFDPTVAGIGFHTVSYVVTNDFGCENIDTRTVRIHDLPTVNAGDTVVYCFTPDNIQLTGFTPLLGGLWSGTGIIDANNGVFNSNMAGANGIGVYDDIVLTFTDNNNCTNFDTLVIETVFGDTIDAGPDFALCIDDGLTTLTGYIPANGGSWSGTGIINANDGIFDPATAGGGLHTLIYTFGTGTCLKRDTIEVNVGIIPTVVAGNNQVVCIDEPAFNLTGFSPQSGVWSGNGITDTTLGTFNPDSAGVGLHTLTYTYTNAITGCENFATKTIRVNDLPTVNAGGTVTYCNNPNNIMLTGYSPLGGNWSGTGIIDAANGIFNTISAGGEGTYFPIYTYTDGNGCTNFDTLIVEVIYGDTVDAGPAIGVCVTDGIYTINNGYTPSSGGTWSGPGVVDGTNGIVDLTSLQTNTSHTLYYTYGIGTCQKLDSTTIFVGTIPFVEAGVVDTICELDGILTLTGFVPSAGGVWSGTGIVPNTNTFDPSISGAGTFTLTYYYQNTFTGCENTDTKTVTVVPAPTVNAGNGNIVCNNTNDIVLGGYSPLGGVWTGSGITNPSGVFNTIIAGGLSVDGSDTTYTLTYTYTDGNGCSNSDTVLYTVIYGDTVNAGVDRNVCIDGGAITLTGSQVGGTWSGTGIINPSGIFDPATAGTGSHTITYTYGTGTCQKTDDLVIFVSPALSIQAGSDLTVCEADPIFTLTGNVPSTGGTWSGTGILDVNAGTFDPSVAGIGTHTITYSFSNTNTGCSDTDTRVITVTPPPTVSAGNDQLYCNSGTNIVLSGYSPQGGTWSGPGIIDPILGEFNTQLAGGTGYNNADTTYQLVYEYSTGTCSDRDTILVTVEFGDTVEAGAPEAVCITDPSFNLTGFSPSDGTGTWSGVGIIDGILGTFDPATATAGTHTLTYTYGVATCQKTDTKTITVHPLPTVNAGTNFAVCINDATFALSGYSPINGTWSGDGIVDGNLGTFDPATAGIGTHTLTYTYVHPITNCENTDTRIVTVNDLPVITMADTTQYCDNPDNVTLTGYSPTGGTWSGPGIVDAANGIFNSNQSGANGVGVYTLIYTYTDGNGCSNTEDLILDIIYGDTVVAGGNQEVCIDDVSFNLTGFSPIGGNWTGTGIIDALLGTFDPVTAGVGTHILTYTYGTGTCEKTVTKSVTVNDLPIVNAGNDQSVCLNDVAFTLSGYSPIGGVWTGTGITDGTVGIFDPATSGVGTFTLTYVYTNASTGCDASDTKVITVNDLPVITMADTTQYCDNPDNVTLTGYSPTGGTWSGPGIVDAANGIFNSTQSGANGVGVYTLLYTYTDGNGCSNTEDLILDIIYGDTVVAGGNQEVCIDDVSFNLTGFSPIGGNWTGMGIVDGVNGTFDPATAGLGTHIVTYTYGTGTCEKTVTKSVTVNDLPVVNAGNDQSVCLNDASFTLSGYSPIGGVWTGTGITDGTVGIFDPATSGVGTFTLTYVYTNSATGCDALDTKVITVNDLPVITMVDTIQECDNPNNITLTGYTPTGGTWSGPGIVDAVNGIFNSTQSGANGVGVYQVFYTYTNNNGCSNTEDLILDIIYGDTVVAGPNVAICIDNGLLTLSGFSPAGGTYSGNGIVDATNGVFDPTLAGVGTHVITYEIGTGTCLKTVTSTVTVEPLPVVNAGLNESNCVNEVAYVLGGQSPSGGIWTGNGITDGTIGMFDPATAGVGTHTLTYTYTNPSTGCEASDTKLVTINALPLVSVTDTVVYCLTINNITLTGYSPTGGIWTGNGIIDNNNGVFNGNSAGGVGTYQTIYTYTDNNSCEASDTMMIIIEPAIPVSAGPDTAICIDNGNYQLTGFSPTGGTWTGNGIIDATNGVLDPQLAGAGNVTLTYTVGSGSCMNTDEVTIFIGTSPVVNAGVNDTICYTDNAFDLLGASPLNGTWTGIGVSPTGNFDPAIAGVGTFTLTYTYMNAITSCEDFDTKTVTVLSPPSVDAGSAVTYCNTNQNVTLTNYTPAGGIWTGPGVVDNTNGVFNPNVAGGEGTYQLIYSYTSAIGCSNIDSLVVEVIYGDTVYAGLPDTVCIDDAQFTLAGFTPVSGGIWTGNGVVDANTGIFDPATAGVGNHTISYTYGIGTCEKISSKTVFVGALPTISLGVNDTICIDASAFNISGYSPQGGTWTGTGITDGTAGTFDPSVAGIGTHTVSYTFVNDITDCDRTVSKQIVVRPLPNVFVANSVTYCDNSNDITLTGFSPAGGVWTGAGIVSSNGIFNTSIAGGLGYNSNDTTYILTYTYTDSYGCENFADMTVNVIFGDTVQAGPNINVCIDDAPIILTGQLPTSGGTWSGTGITDPVLGTFDPATAGVGTHIVTWTYGTGTCLKTSSRSVTVSNPPTISAGIDETFCINDAPILLSGYSPLGGTWSGTGITDGTVGIFDPSVSGIGTFTLTYYYFNTATNCDAADTKIITVAPLPTVTTASSVTYCDNPNNITLTGYSPQGGTWSGPGILDGTTGIFNTGQAGGLGPNNSATVYTLTYTYADGNGCINSADMTVNVIFGDTVQAGPAIAVCKDDGLVTLTGQLPASGGTWSGTGIIDPVVGLFDPVTAGVGTHIVTWTYGTGTCLKTSTRSITVSDPPNVSAGTDQTICIDASPILLGGYSPTGGTWSGVGMTDTIVGIFDPSVSGIGTFTLTYYYYNASTNCDASDTKTITVAPLPTVTTANSVTYCENPNNITLTGYTPAGGFWSGAGILNGAAGVFNTGQAGGLAQNNGDTTYTLTYTYTDGNGCINSADMTVNVIFGDTVEAGPNIIACIDDGLITLTGQTPATGGTWTGTGIIDPVLGIFDPVTAGIGTHIVTISYGTGTCLKTSTRSITISNPPTVNAGVNQTVCIDDAPILLGGNSPSGGVWSGIGITDSIVGLFDPSVSGTGTFTLTYYYYNASTDCDASDTKTIVVAPLPTVSTTSSITYCDNPNNITLTGYSPAGGVWSGPGILNSSTGVFNTGQAGGLGYNNGDTTYILTYSYTSAAGCENSSTMTVNIIFGDTVQAGPNFAVCIDAPAVTLNDQTPLGGTWSGTGISDPAGIFDPANAGVGTHILTYTSGTGTCLKTSTRTVTVGAVPTVNAGVDLNVCEGDAAFILGGNTPLSGTWSGIGITNTAAGLFDPTVSGTGTFVITYAFTNAVTGCEGLDTRTIVVNQLPIVTTEDSTLYCFSSNNIQLTGFTPTTGGQWSGAGIVNPNTGVFNPGQTPGLGYNNGDTTYILTYTYTDGNGCTDAETLLVELTEGDTVQAGPNIAVCITDLPLTLTGNLPTTGGTWSGTGIIDPVAGIFDPANAGAGTHVLTWTFGTGTCEKTSTRTVTVGSPPSVNAGLDEFICIDAGQVLLSNYSPLGGIWNGSGIVDSIVGMFDPIAAGNGQHTVSYYVVNTITGCENTDYKTITVGDLPIVSVTDSVLFCNNPNNILLEDYVSVTPTGGIWVGPGVVDPVNGIFSTTIAGGLAPNNGDTTYTLIYKYAGGNTCEAEDTLTISVIFGDTVLAGTPDTLCLGDNPITFTGFSPAGGTWSGLGIINSGVGEFDPNASGVGLHTVTYTYGTGTCQKKVTKTVLVDAPPTISIGPDQTVCIDATPFVLGGYSPQGGIWSGVGVTDSIAGVFNPANAGQGTHTLTYEFVNSISGCSNTDTRDITVVPLPIVNAGDSLIFCDNPSNILLSDYVSYNPQGGTWSGDGVVDPSLGIFSTVSAGGLGDYDIIYGYTDGNGCFSDDSLHITVIYGDTVVGGPNVALCIDDGLYQLDGFSPFGGLWSSVNTTTNNAIVDAVNGIFDPSVAGAGPHTLTYTFGSGTCQKAINKIIFVGTPPVVNPGANQTICVDVPAFTLGGFSPSGGTWTGPGVLDSLTGVFDPVTAGGGIHTLFYRVTNQVTGCETIASKTITINLLPSVYAGDTLEVCNNPNNITLSGYSPSGGFWTGDGIVDATGGVFNTGAAGGLGTNGMDTIYPVIYHFTDMNSCANNDTLLIEVIYGDTVLAGLNDSVCIDDAPFFLGGSPLGGVWTGSGVTTASGMFTAASAGPGSHVIMYTYGSGTCEKTDQKIIYVGTPLQIDAGPDQYACADAIQLFLSGQSITDGVWSGAGIVDGVTGEFDPQIVGIGFHTVLYTYTDPATGCVSTDTKQVEVKPLPVVNAGGTVTYCNWPLDIQLTNYSPTGNGGTWSGLGIINASQGTFNTITAGGIGTHTVTYTFTDNFGCINTDDLIIDVIYGDTVKAGPDRTVCIDGGNIQLIGNSPVGGIYSGTGVTAAGLFDPTVVGGGVHEVIYTQGAGTCVKSDTLEITVIDLTGTTAGPDESTCLESGPVVLTGNLPLGGVWSGSGITDATLGIFEPQTANNDTVFITYTYTDAISGCSYSDTKMVTVTPLPNIDFVMSADTLCIGDILSVTNTSDVNVTNFQWFFGDGDSSIFFQPTHTYNTAGTYQIMLVGVSPEGCPDTSIQTIEIYELPTPSFAVSTDDGCGPLPVAFTNTSVGQDMEFLWNFGNGQTSTLQNPGTVTYQPGVSDTLYVVTLEVTNRCGVVTFTDSISVRATPNAILGADATSGCTPLPVNFTNFSTGNATAYVWDFDNGNISTDSIPPTQFFTTVDTNTVYTVTLTASNACGSDNATIDITAEPGSIDAFFTPDTTIGCQALTVNLASLATAGSTVTWDFGDGNTLAGPGAVASMLSYTYDTAGTFTITQYASNYCGADTFSVDITVHSKPEVSFVHASFICQDVPLLLTNTSPQVLAGVTWDFGDGTTSTSANPQHAYSTPGTYTITMTGYSTTFACPADTQSTIQVLGKPNATFAASANSGCAPLGVNFTNTSSNGAMFYSWDFGDGNVSNLENPNHLFTGTGNYVVTLTVGDTNGCEDDTTMVNFIVFPSPTSAFVPDATSQCGLNDYVELENTSTGSTQYYWDFGNGQYSNLTDPVINYNQLGDYTITLITQNQYNCTDTAQTLYSVIPAPSADFEIESQNGCEPLTVQFTQSSTNSTLFYWYFGDGDSAAVANPIHTYNDGGTYDVTMVASLDNICFDTFYIPAAIYVDQAPTASFIIEEVSGSGATGTYNFVNTSVGATEYYWDFGDGGTSTDENPQHRYDYNGLRQVQLIAVSATGCTDTMLIELEPTFFRGLYVPNAFSPNVGIGDVREFRPVGVGLQEYRVEVFSQWGELLWSSDVLDDNGVPVEGWDGTYNGRLMPQGAYVWKVHAVFTDGSNWEGMPDFEGIVRKIGSVTLLD